MEREVTVLIRNKTDLNNLTQPEAKDWLIENDSEAAEYWKSLPCSTDFREAVRDNINDFGFDE
jgi:hypothetical protein